MNEIKEKEEETEKDDLNNIGNINLDDIEESNEYLENENEENEEEQEKIIEKLQQKIVCLEKMNKDLKLKNEDLTKNNIEKNSVMAKMSSVGLRRKFTLSGTKVQNDTIKLAKIIKEKDDLQEMNEKMLDLLTEKELENEELIQNFENYKLLYVFK